MFKKNFLKIGQKKVNGSKKGFTLVEMIVTLLIVGLLAAIGGLGIVEAIKGYLTVKNNETTTQKAQLAISRITREIQEMINVPQNASSTSLPITGTANCASNSNCVRTIALVGNQLVISAGSNVDTLIDNVTSLKFTYFSANVPYTTWAPGNDAHLNGVGVNMTITTPSGQSVTFGGAGAGAGGTGSTGIYVMPRNNGNLGGANMPTSTPAGTPAQWNISGCFVATAAYGDPGHPMVQILREFRDKYLLTFSAGKWFVYQYYQHGPAAADLMRAWARLPRPARESGRDELGWSSSRTSCATSRRG